MSTPSKDKGDRAERALVAHLQANGFPHARRTKAGGAKDLGDLSGVIDRDGDLWCVQVADRRWRSHGEVEAKAGEAAEQAERLGASLWCLVAKRPGCADPGDWFVWLRSSDLIACIADRALPLDYDPTMAALLWGDAESDDLACITVRTWLALVAPQSAEAAA